MQNNTRDKIKEPLSGRPKVSIITCSLNSGEFMEETILNVRRQTYQNSEYVIIDGGSTDSTLDVIKKCEERIDRWISEPDRGISDAFNKGIRESTGDIIGFMNSQDYYYTNDVVEKVVTTFEQNPGVSIVYGKTCYVPINSSEIVGVMGRPFTPEGLARSNIMPHQSLFVRREVFDQVGLFKLEYKYVMDYEFLLRATKRYRPMFIDEVFAIMRLGGVSDIRKFAVNTELFKAQVQNGEPLAKSFMTLLWHYVVSAGLRALRGFNVYTLGHLYKRLRLKREVS